ncbi:MAG: LicD family protein [Deltaproteobacteria bacterium]|nr:LicD family protein [Deltaproteobacteria bacterium]
MDYYPNLTEKNLIKARKVLFNVVDFLESEGIGYHLEGGTLLGLVRDHELLPWDHDVDLSINVDDSKRFAKKRWKLFLKGYRVTTRKMYRDTGAFKKGQYRIFKVKQFLPSIIKWAFPVVKKYMVVADVFVKASDKQFTYWQAMDKIMRVDNKYYSSYEIIEYNGLKLRVPFEYENYLTDKFGDWKTPVQKWNCGENEKTIVGDAFNF